MRKLKLAVLAAAKRLGLFDVAKKRTAKAVRILCYHGVWLGEGDMDGDAMFISRATFEARLEVLKASGYPVIPLADAVAALSGRCSVPANSVVITIDDGWYSTYSAMLPALTARAMPATLYCDTAHLVEGLPIAHVMARYCRGFAGEVAFAGNVEEIYARATDRSLPMAQRLEAARQFCALAGIDAEKYISARVFDYMSPTELRDAYEAGLDIQLHTHNHTLGDLSRKRAVEEVQLNRISLSKMLGVEPSSFNHFCYPSGINSVEAAEGLKEAGVLSSTTTDASLCTRQSELQFLPRFLDGEQVSQLEFEAEVSGFADFLRGAVSAQQKLIRGVGALMPGRGYYESRTAALG